MKRILMLFIFAVVGFTSVNAQDDDDFDYYTAPSFIWTFNYSMATPSGDFASFINDMSFRGLSVEGRHFLLDNKISVGLSYAWNGFYNDAGRLTYEFDGGAITSNMYKYLYTTSLDVSFHYYVLDKDSKIQLYVGILLGPHYNKRKLQVGSYAITDESWNFGVAPEVGVFVPFGKDAEWGFNASAKYNTMIYERTNFSSLNFIQYNLGFSYTY